jgi:hypothetical protein
MRVCAASAASSVQPSWDGALGRPGQGQEVVPQPGVFDLGQAVGLLPDPDDVRVPDAHGCGLDPEFHVSGMAERPPDVLISRLGDLFKHAQIRLNEAVAAALAPFGIDGRELAVLVPALGGVPLLIPWSDISNPDLSGGKVRDVTEV